MQHAISVVCRLRQRFFRPQAACWPHKCSARAAVRRTDGGAAAAGRFDQSQTRSSPHPSTLFRPCLRPSERVPVRSVPSKPPPDALDGTERAGTRSDGRKQGRNSADGCGEDRAQASQAVAVWRRLHGHRVLTPRHAVLWLRRSREAFTSPAPPSCWAAGDGGRRSSKPFEPGVWS